MVSTSGCTFATPQRFKRMSKSKSHSRSPKSEAETKLDFKCFLGSLGGTGLSPPELSVRRLAFQPGPGWYFPDPPGLISPAFFLVLSILLGSPVTFQHANHWQQSLVYLKGFLWLPVTVLITDRWLSLPVSKSEGPLSLLRLSLLPQASCYVQDCGSSVSLPLR